jgi:hypothetical protein
MSLIHAYTLTNADGTATSVVRPSDWNSAHNQYMTIAGNTAGQSTASGTNIVFSGGNNVTLSINQGAGVATVVMSGANTVAQTQQPMYFSASGTNTSASTLQFGNTQGVSFSLSNGSVVATVKTDYLTTAMQSNAYTTMGGTGFTSTTTAGANITAVMGSNGISMAVPQYITTALQSQMTSNYMSTAERGNYFYTSNNTFANNTHTHGMVTTTTNGSLVTVGSNSGGYTLAVPPFLTAAGAGGAQNTVSLIGNVVGNNSVPFANDTVYISGGANITMSGTGNTIVISAAAPGGGGVGQRSYVEINQGERLTTVRVFSETVFTNRPQFFPFWVEGTGIVPRTARMFISGIASSNRSFGGTYAIGLYSQVNSSQLTFLTSAQQSFSITAGTQSSLWNGPSVMDFTGMSNFTFTAEGRYVAALLIRPVSANVSWANQALYGCDPYPSFTRVLQGNTTAATNASYQLLPWQGVYSTTTAGLPNTIAKSEIYGGNSASANQPYMVFMGI